MGAAASFTGDEAMYKRKAARQTNYTLTNMLNSDFTDGKAFGVKHQTLYFSVKESLLSLESFFGFLLRYHHSPIMLHSLIVRQIKYIINILKILTHYDSKVMLKNNIKKFQPNSSIFYCRQQYSSKWIMSTYQCNIALTYEQGKKILRVWNDNATQTLILLMEKYDNHDQENKENKHDTNKDRHYYDHIKLYLEREYPIDYKFCQYFVTNVLKFCFNEMTIETHLERKLFLNCLTNNGKFPLTKQSLIIDGYSLSNLCLFCCFVF